jgi:hypothetical protein
MSRFRAWPVLALAAGLLLSSGIVAQPPNLVPGARPKQVPQPKFVPPLAALQAEVT